MPTDGSATDTASGAGETLFVNLGEAGEPVLLPGGNEALKGDFAREGSDLHIELPGGDTIVVVDFYAGGPDALPTLMTESGSRILGETASKLAGPETAGQVAQSDGLASDASALGEPVGTIDAMKGTATAIRADGTEVQLEAGSEIYENDTIVTGPDSALGVLFVDDSTMSMGGDARIVVDQMVYDDSNQTGNQLFDVVQGAFVFASGHIGKTNPEDVEVRTPVATIGIRGTKYGVNVGAEGGDTTVTLFEGAVTVSNGGGEQVLSSVGQTTTVGSFQEKPSDVTTMDPLDQARTYGDAIAYSPDQPALEQSGQGNNDPTKSEGDQAVLDEAELEKLAEQLNDVEAAAGPSGAIAAVTKSAAFLRLLNGLLEGSGSLQSGTLANDNDGGSDFAIFSGDEDDKSDFSFGSDEPVTVAGGSDPLPTGSINGTYTYNFDPNDPVEGRISGGSGNRDLFTINMSESAVSTGWTVSQDENGNVVITEANGTRITMDEVEEFRLDLGTGADSTTVNDLTATDIVNETVYLNGGEGNDDLDASNLDKRAVIDGGADDDVIRGGSYDGGDADSQYTGDDLRGGAGDDEIYGGVGDDLIDGGADDDYVEGGTGDDVITGGAGDDDLFAGAGDDIVEGGAGADAISGGDGDDSLFGGAGDDAIDGGAGDDFIDAGAGADTITYTVGDGADVIDGGAGTDGLIISYTAADLADPAIAADLAALAGGQQGTFDALGLTLSNVEAIELDGPAPDLDVAVDLSVGAAVEDQDIPLSITLTGGTAGAVATSVALAGLPAGYTLTNAAGDSFPGGGTITLASDQLDGLAITAPANASESLSLSVTATTTSLFGGGENASNTADAAIDPQGVADTPELSAGDVSGLEDGAIALDLSATVTDDSEDLTLVISGLPEGATLSAGTVQQDGSVLLTADQLDGLTLTPPANASGDFTLSVTAFSADGESVADASTSFTLSLDAVADTPDLIAEDATGDEDGVIPLNLSAAVTDDSEDLTLVVSGLPEGATLSAGTVQQDGSVLLTADQLDGLTLTPSANASGDFTLSVTAFSADGESVADASTSFTLSLDAVADTPTLTIDDPSVSGIENGDPIALNIDAALADIDGSESLTVRIEGLPGGATLSAGAVQADGSVLLSASELSGLTVLPAPNSDLDFTLTVTATATETSNQDSAVATGTIEVDVLNSVSEPVLTVGDQTIEVVEDASAIPLDIAASTLGDDASETLTIRIEGLPQGATLSAGTVQQDGSVLLTAEELDGLTLTPAGGDASDIALTVTATNVDGDDQLSTQQTLSIAIAAAADAPSVVITDESAMEGLAGDDLIEGTAGDDVLTGGAGDDSLVGGAGDDLLIGDGANTAVSVPLSIDIGLGDDLDGSESISVTLTLPQGVTLTDAQGNAVEDLTFTPDELSGLQAVVQPGTGDFEIGVRTTVTDTDPDGGADEQSFTDTLSVTIDAGEAGNDVLDGGTGADTLISGDGDDLLSLTVDPDSGQDVVDGGAGSDTLTLTVGPIDLLDVDLVADIVELADWIAAGPTAGEERVFEALSLKVKDVDALNVIDLDGQSIGIESLRTLGIDFSGDDANDIVTGTDNADTISGGGGDDQLSGGGGDDYLDGGDGADIIDGGDGSDTLIGGDGDDTLTGSSGDDLIQGGADDDQLTGGGGNDVIEGGAGDDTATFTYVGDGTTTTFDGGAGFDTLRIELSAGMDSLDQAIAEIAAAVKAAKTDPDALQSLETIGLDFQNVEDVQLFVDGTEQTFKPTVTGLQPLAIDTDTLFAGTQVARDIAIQDADSPTLMQASVTIAGGMQSGDALTIDESVLQATGLEVVSAGPDGSGNYTLVLSGDAPVAAYEEALAAVRLINDDQAPEPGDRSISITVTDDDGIASDAATADVAVSADPPAIADGEGADNDSVAFVSAAGEDGAVVTALEEANAPETTTETLKISVARLGVGPGNDDDDDDGYEWGGFEQLLEDFGELFDGDQSNGEWTNWEDFQDFLATLGDDDEDENPQGGGNGKFEVTINGVSLGIFTASFAAGGLDTWGVIEIPGIEVTEGETLDIDISAVNPGTSVGVSRIELGDRVLEAEDAVDLSGGVLEDGYISLDGGSVGFQVATNAPDADAFDTWLLQNVGGEEALSEADLDQLFDGVDMGDGQDWVAAASGVESALTVDLSGDVWSGAEHVAGGTGDDVLIGNDAANILAGADGNDRLVADGSDDLLLGGAGDDRMEVSGDDLSGMGGETDFGDRHASLDAALDANSLDAIEGLDGGRSGIDGGSGYDTLKLTAGPSDGSIDGDDVSAVDNIEALDIVDTGGKTDVNLSLEDVISMTDDENELTILKGQDDTVTIAGEERGVGEFNLDLDGTMVKITIEEEQPVPDAS